MKRVPEPELMDAADQVEAYATADFSETDQALVDRIVAATHGRAVRRIVDLGCGPGNITLRLAGAFPDAHIVGVDGAETMLEVARARRELGDHARVDFVQAVLPTEVEAEPCDLVVSNSLLHHLHDPAVFWREVCAWALEGAFVFVADLARPATPEDVDRLTLQYAGDAPPVLREDFRASLHAAFEDDEIRAQLEAVGLEHLRIDHPTDRHVHVFGPRTLRS